MKLLKNITFRKYLFLTWFVFILIISSIPNVSVNKVEISDKGFHIRLDYILHFTIFLILALLYLSWKNEYGYRNILLTVFFGIIYASLTEYEQKIIPGRTFNPFDLIYNSSGFVTGCILMVLFKKKSKK